MEGDKKARPQLSRDISKEEINVTITCTKKKKNPFWGGKGKSFISSCNVPKEGVGKCS